MNPWIASLFEGLDWALDRWRHESDPESVAFDREHGVDTARWTLDYEPVRPAVCETVLDALPADSLDGDFYDLGCGKGRALLIASRRPFRRVIGVEVVAGLAATCRANFDVWDDAHPDCGPLEVLHTDAMDLRLPPGNITLFLYNPFGEDVVQRVLDRVVRHHVPGRAVTLAYVNPLEEHLVTDPPWEVLANGGEDPERWTIYRLRAT